MINMYKCKFILPLIFIFLSAFTSQVMACSCVEEQNVAEAFKKADIVFLGSVTKFAVVGEPEEVEFDNRTVPAYRNGRKAEFRVQKIFKGSPQETVTVLTGEGGGDCGYDFIIGHEYLVYGYEADGQWHTGICSRTKDVWFSDWSDAQEDFEFLEKGQ